MIFCVDRFCFELVKKLLLFVPFRARWRYAQPHAFMLEHSVEAWVFCSRALEVLVCNKFESAVFRNVLKSGLSTYGSTPLQVKIRTLVAFLVAKDANRVFLVREHVGQRMGVVGEMTIEAIVSKGSTKRTTQ